MENNNNDINKSQQNNENVNQQSNEDNIANQKINNDKNDFQEDLKKEFSKIYLLLKKNVGTSFLVLAWIIIIYSAINLIDLLQAIPNYFKYFKYSTTSYNISIFLNIASLTVLAYTGYGILKYKKWVPTSLLIFLVIKIISIILAPYFQWLWTIIYVIAITLAIFWWISDNKKLFNK